MYICIKLNLKKNEKITKKNVKINRRINDDAGRRQPCLRIM